MRIKFRKILQRKENKYEKKRGKLIYGIFFLDNSDVGFARFTGNYASETVHRNLHIIHHNKIMVDLYSDRRIYGLSNWWLEIKLNLVVNSPSLFGEKNN
jgi:hypothetical protein